MILQIYKYTLYNIDASSTNDDRKLGEYGANLLAVVHLCTQAFTMFSSFTYTYVQSGQ